MQAVPVPGAEIGARQFSVVLQIGRRVGCSLRGCAGRISVGEEGGGNAAADTCEEGSGRSAHATPLLGRCDGFFPVRARRQEAPPYTPSPCSLMALRRSPNPLRQLPTFSPPLPKSPPIALLTCCFTYDSWPVKVLKGL